MKKLICASVACLAIMSCKQEPKDYVTFSGKIENKNSDSLVVSSSKLDYYKSIPVDEKGFFKDTLKLKTGVYGLFDGSEYSNVHFKNGDEIILTLDATQFDETIAYEGKGSGESNFLAKSNMLGENFFSKPETLKLSEDLFEKEVAKFKNDYEVLLSVTPLDSSFAAIQKDKLESIKESLYYSFEEAKFIRENLAEGLESPKFIDYENFNGGKTSLDDLKGKYLYIDIWATWCKPCKNEIPFLKKLEEEYRGKNIEFVSISVDQKRAYETWKKMVKDEALAGVQLFADNNWNSKFIRDYAVSGIPRFIIIDTDGKIVNADAPRPSNEELPELLDKLVL